VLPVLCVHGIWDTSAVFSSMQAALRDRGFGQVVALDLVPNDGSADIPALAKQVAAAADALGGGPLDVVGFSMGALVSRYWLQRMGGRERVRRFISISGPHRGTITAMLSGKPGPKQMRPNSALLNGLFADQDPWGRCEVHAFWTPFDLIIVPSGSSALPGARERKFNVPFHPMMLSDRNVISAVAEVLGAPGGADVSSPSPRRTPAPRPARLKRR
jgi:triacylglycerol esterase/lipase EstA (alpha/beta hydrolase family)